MKEQELEILQGTIGAVFFQNYDNGYSVLRLNLDSKQTVTVVGTIPLPTVGERLMVTGKWDNHSNYGRQFVAEFLERLMPDLHRNYYLSVQPCDQGHRSENGRQNCGQVR